MTLRLRHLACVAAIVIGLARPAIAQSECAVELVLAVDVSGSVDHEEHALQMGGIASAFRHPDAIDAISALDGGLLVTVMQWSGLSHQRQTTPWRHVTDAESSQAFADDVARGKRAFRIFSTAIGEALRVADTLSTQAPLRCRRRVIDVSGDGVTNEGAPPLPISRALSAQGVTINGLVIKGDEPDPEPHYRNEVVSGPAAFVMRARTFEDFPDAFLRKLLRELQTPVAQR